MLSFGGGICVPVALGFRPFPLANDAAVTLLLLAWWLMHYCPGDAVYKAFTQAKPLRVLLVCGFEVARCNVVVTWLTRAHEVSPYQPLFRWRDPPLLLINPQPPIPNALTSPCAAHAAPRYR